MALSQRFGKLPFAELMQLAIDVAERGYAVPTVVANGRAATLELQNQPGFAQAFLPRGRAPLVGELFRFPAAARAFRSPAASGGESFYRGDIAQAIARFAAQHGGALTEADLAAHTADWSRPLPKRKVGHTLHQKSRPTARAWLHSWRWACWRTPMWPTSPLDSACGSPQPADRGHETGV